MDANALSAHLFREVNDRIRELAGRWEDTEPLGFVCECTDMACAEVVNLSLAEYDTVRSRPGHFLLLRGHEPDDAGVVASVNGYVVLETPTR